MKQVTSISIIFVTLLSLVVIGCKKEDDTPLPANPFDNITYGTLPVEETPDPNSLVGIHSNILHPKCAVPGCHDGNFEPDFRTPQSSFATLVYHPIVKNNIAETFSTRVIPYNPTQSVSFP